jgi:hypothetical protein
MAFILVRLPEDRSLTGTLEVVDDQRNCILGPFQVCGKASDATALFHNNPGRSPILPFGDTPSGTFKLEKILPTGAGTIYAVQEYGPHGVIILRPLSDEAALADANGRFHIFIQGGHVRPDGKLTTTNGSLRLANKDQLDLITLSRSLNGLTCLCESTPTVADSLPIAEGENIEEGDPPPLPPGSPPLWGVGPSKGKIDQLRGPMDAKFSLAAPVSSAFAGGDYDTGDIEHYSIKSGVNMTDQLEANAGEVADNYFSKTGQDIVVTDGVRTAEDQASAMVYKLENGDDLSIYTNKEAVKEIKEAYNAAVEAGKSKDEIVSDVTGVIQSQVDSGVYVSKHLAGNAFDVRSQGMTPAQKQDFRKSVAEAGGTVIEEGIPPHFHVQF